MESCERYKMRKMDIKEVQNELFVLMNELHKFLVKNGISYYLIAGSTLGAVRHGGFIPWDDDIDIGMFRDDYDAFLRVMQNFSSKYEIINFQNGKHCDYVLCRIYINNTMIDNPTIAKTKLDKRLYLDVFPIDNVPESEDECAKFEKKIVRKKTLLSYCDVRDYNNGRIKLVLKKFLAFILSPFRSSILNSCDTLMRKYQNVDTKFVCSLCSQYSFKKQKMPRDYYGTPSLHSFEEKEFFIPMRTEEYLTKLYGSDYMQLPPESMRRKGYDIYRICEE